jgi:hypothetical protein
MGKVQRVKGEARWNTIVRSGQNAPNGRAMAVPRRHLGSALGALLLVGAFILAIAENVEAAVVFEQSASLVKSAVAGIAHYD